MPDDALFVSFSCICGAEIDLPEHPRTATEIVCIACDTFIGHYYDLLPPAKARRQKSRRRTKAAAKPHRRRT